jgi:hypothetical protein
MLPALHGARAKVLKGNVVRIVVTGEEFSFGLDGFDRFRDLYVRVDDVSGVDSAEDGDDQAS